MSAIPSAINYNKLVVLQEYKLYYFVLCACKSLLQGRTPAANY